MATKAAAFVQPPIVNPQNEMFFNVTVCCPDEQKSFNHGPFPLGTVMNASFLNTLIAATKAFATAECGITFGQGDTLQIFFPNAQNS